jgi:hypothetical protein
MVFGRNLVVTCGILMTGLANMYTNQRIQFKQETFWNFNALVEAHHNTIPMLWIPATSRILNLNAFSLE